LAERLVLGKGSRENPEREGKNAGKISFREKNVRKLEKLREASIGKERGRSGRPGQGGGSAVKEKKACRRLRSWRKW